MENRKYCMMLYVYRMEYINKEFITIVDSTKRINYAKLLAYLDDNDIEKVNLSIDAMCIMSYNSANVLKLTENVKLLPRLLAHAGVFDNCATRRNIFARYKLPSKENYSFWSASIRDSKIRRFLCENYISLYEKRLRNKISSEKKEGKIKKEIKKETESGHLSCCNLCPCGRKGLETLCNEENGYFSPEWDWETRKCPSEKEVAALIKTVTIIADTLRNLSVDQENAALMGRNTTFLRYLLLNLSCTNTYLRKVAEETLINVSPFMNVADPEKHPLIHCIISIVAEGIRNEKGLVQQMRCFIIVGGWYTIRKNPVSKRAAQRNYSSLNKFKALDLKPVTAALNRYINNEDLRCVHLIIQLLSKISLHGKRGCDDFCNQLGDIIKTLVGLCTHELKYNWDSQQLHSLLEKLDPYHKSNNDMSNVTSVKKQKKTKPPKVNPKTAIQTTTAVQTDYCIVTTNASASICPQIVDITPTVEAKFGNIPEGFSRKFDKEKFEKDKLWSGENFEKFEEKLRIDVCTLLKNIAKFSAVGRRMILMYETRLFMQAMKYSTLQMAILEVLEALGSKYLKYSDINKL